MPKTDKSVVVLPCHALEDFPIHETGQNADSLLATWTAPWHPSLLAAHTSIPDWTSEDFINIDLDHALIFVPINCNDDLPEDFDEAIKNQGSVMVPRALTREEILCEPTVAALIDQQLNSESVNAFFALGYAYLQIQLMTRQLRYSTTIDTDEFQRRVVEAANQCVNKNNQGTQSALTSCFDLLLEERNNFYPTDPQLIQLVLAPPSGNLKGQLQIPVKTNLLGSGSILKKIASDFPDQLAIIKARAIDKSLEMASAPDVELPIQLVGIESVLNQLKLGLDTQTNLIEKTNQTFGSFRFGLTAHLPNLLEGLGQESALHVAFSGGKIPNTSAPVINWQGLDGTNIRSYAGSPIDAASPDSFLGLGVTIGEMLDGYHHCELMLAHWPQRTCVWFDTLIQIERFCPLFGRFVTLTEFTETIHDSGFSDTFLPDDYQFPYLEEAHKNNDVNPISKWQLFWSSFSRLRCLQAFTTSAAVSCNQTLPAPELLRQIGVLQDRLESSCNAFDSLKSAADEIAGFMGDVVTDFESGSLDGTINSEQKLYNPSQSKKCFQHVTDSSGTSIQIPPLASVTLAELPTDFVEPKDPAVLDANADGLPILRNEFFEILVDGLTGGIRSVNRPNKKGNLFSQQIAGRISREAVQHGHPRQHSRYTTMQVDEFYTHADSNRRGQIRSKGQLLDNNPASDSANPIPFAHFDQTITVERGSNRIRFDISLQTIETPIGNPWRNYIGNRIAWANEDAQVFRSDHEVADQVYREKFVSPQFVEINSDDAKVTILTGGLPYHRRSSRRMLDTLLVCENESQRHFTFAIEIDARTSTGAAKDYLAPCFVVDSSTSESLSTGWIFHLNYKNVVVTFMEPVFNERQEHIGVCMRLQETEGRGGELRIRGPYNISKAVRCNFRGTELSELKTEANAAICNFLAHQFFQVNIYW